MHLLTPTQSPDYYAQHPSRLLVDQETDRNTAGAGALLAKAAAAHIHYLTSVQCTPRHRGRPLPSKSPSQGEASISNSLNWSGYVSGSSGTNYLGTQMEWTVPTVVEPSNLSVVTSIWPGIGSGDSTSDTLVQAGTEQDGICETDCATHSTYYYFWVELVPGESQQEITNLTVSPGDNVGAIVQYNASQHQAFFELIDLTTNQGVYLYQDFTGGSGQQTEWIVERTQMTTLLGESVLPSLNNFGTEDIINAEAAVGSNWSSPTTVPADSTTVDPQPWNMYDCAGLELAKTGPFAADTAFTVQWLNYGPTDPATC